MSSWNVLLKKKTLKETIRLPSLVKDKFIALVNDLKIHGPYPGDN